VSIKYRLVGLFLINSPGNINFDHIGLALSGVVHHALSVQHQTVSWLQTLGDIYLGKCFYPQQCVSSEEGLLKVICNE